MEKKKCTSCSEEKTLEQFSKNTDYCKECARKHYQNHKKKQIKKYGKKRYLEIQWEKRLKSKCKKAKIPIEGFDKKKIKELKWPMIDYSDRFFPFGLSHLGFIKKYDLTVEEYVWLRKMIKQGNFFVL